MSEINYQALREAAEKATKGQWAVEFDDEIYSTDGVNHEQIAMVFSENESRDAAFIAAANPAKRIMFREYDRLIITKGYPKRDDSSRRIDVPYDGYEIKTITHPHFGDKPVKVFAIKVNIGNE